jgi:hypothetical protein
MSSPDRPRPGSSDDYARHGWVSRGVWCSAFQHLADQGKLTASIFAPLEPDPTLIADIVYRHGLQADWMICDWSQSWPSYKLFNRLSVWFPPPEIARKLITYLLKTWSEVPWSTSMLLFVPRVMSGFWFGLSKHIVELEIIDPRFYPLALPPALPIPLVVLYIPAHMRSLPTRDRLAWIPSPFGSHWHKQQATLMRELPPRSLA